MEKPILLGFEVGTGEPVYLPLHHLAIFGITQLSGKTTALEALVSRSGLRAIAFITKRGESGFSRCNIIQPYYRPRADWMFIEGLVNVALGEKIRYEPGMRWAIIKVSKNARNLREVKLNAERMLTSAKREFHKQVFEKLITYLEIVVPELERWHFSERLELSDGVNVMDLSLMRTETQHLVIASTIEYVFQNMDHVVVIIPEAWETLPQNKMTPVKWVAQQFIRKGAAIGNYLWVDSQDIGSIDKAPLRQCDNWLMGRMKEAHEVERVLKQLLGMKVPAEEIQTLPLGHFYAVIGDTVKKVYVLPAGVPENVGKEVALGKRTPESVRDEYLKPKKAVMPLSAEKNDAKIEYEKLIHENQELSKQLGELKKEVNLLKQAYNITVKQLRETSEKLEKFRKLENALFEVLAPQLNVRLKNAMPSPTASEIIVNHEAPTLTIEIVRKPLQLSSLNVQGRLAILYAKGFFDEKERPIAAIQEEMVNRGWQKDPRLSNFLDEMCIWGYLKKRKTDRWLYTAAIKSTEARSKGLLKEVEVLEPKT
jgi:hypothetical protein